MNQAHCKHVNFYSEEKKVPLGDSTKDILLNAANSILAGIRNVNVKSDDEYYIWAFKYCQLF